MTNIQTFKEISIGGLSKNQLLEQLVEAGIQFNRYADTLFEHPLFSPAGTWISQKVLI